MDVGVFYIKGREEKEEDVCLLRNEGV